MGDIKAGEARVGSTEPSRLEGVTHDPSPQSPKPGVPSTARLQEVHHATAAAG
jgi:hypothetical protein